MARFHTRRANRVAIRCGLCLSVVLLTGGLPGLDRAVAQGTKKKAPPDKKAAPESEKISGTITEIEKKGKSVTLMIDKEGGDKLEVMLTSKLKFSVSAKGDASLLRPKTVVSSDSVIMAGNKSDLVGRKFTVHLGTPPTAQVQRDPMNQEVYHVCGQIAAVQQDSMTINFGNAGGVRKLLFEQGGPEISVDASDPDLVAVGAKVEVEGTTRGAKFQPSKVTVTREEPITARDLDDNEKKAAAKKGTSPPKTARKPAGKGAGDDAAAGAGNTPSADDDDPLGVFKKDKPKGGKSGAKGSGK